MDGLSPKTGLHFSRDIYQHEMSLVSLGNKSAQNALLECNASIKERLEAHSLNHFGYPKEGSAHGFSPEFVMARTLVRYPNARVRENLIRLHFNMSKKLGGMSDESIEWLLGGSRKTCRGGFANAREFRAFLGANPNTIPPAQLISKLESITSAMGYRAIGDRRQEEPVIPQTPSQQEMLNVISEITHGQMVRSINTVYKQRISDRINGKVSPDEINVILCEQEDELSDDEDDDFRGRPNERIPSALFKMISEDNQFSWIYRAREHGIFVRNHVSGTTPLTLAATTGLLREEDEIQLGILDNEEEYRDLFTALFMPKFLRSGYHSLAETQAGIDHFVAEHSFNHDSTLPMSRETDPITAEQRAYLAMCRATCSDPSLSGMSPRQAMEDYCILREEARKLRLMH